jgi:hypothetical protein
MEDWMKEFNNVDDGLQIEFEDTLNFDDDTPEQRRFFRLDAIIDYAKAHNFPEAAKRAKAAQSTDEDILPILAMIGFTFDGKKLKPLEQKSQPPVMS